jgi:hypothetical protein
MLLCFWSGAMAAGARTMTDFFVDMPDSLMPMLSQNARKDLIDFYRSGMKPLLPNEWSANSQLTKVSDDLVELSEDSHAAVSTTMTLLSLKGRDTLICMVRTISCPQPDSEIFFYTTSWKPLARQQYIALPAAKATRQVTEGSLVDYVSMSLSRTSARIALDVTIDAADGVVDASADKKQVFRYEWNGSKFTPLP